MFLFSYNGEMRETWYALISSLTAELDMYLLILFSVASYLFDESHFIGSGTIFTCLFHLFWCIFHLFALFQTSKGKNAWPQRRKSRRMCHQSCSWRLRKETEACSMARLCASVVLLTAGNTSFNIFLFFLLVVILIFLVVFFLSTLARQTSMYFSKHFPHPTTHP